TYRGDGALAGDDVAGPRELRKPGADLAHAAHAGRVDEELAQVTHRQHAVCEHAGIARVLGELVVHVDGIRVAGGRPVHLQHLLGDGPLVDGRQLLADMDGLRCWRPVQY